MKRLAACLRAKKWSQMLQVCMSFHYNHRVSSMSTLSSYWDFRTSSCDFKKCLVWTSVLVMVFFALMVVFFIVGAILDIGFMQPVNYYIDCHWFMQSTSELFKLIYVRVKCSSRIHELSDWKYLFKCFVYKCPHVNLLSELWTFYYVIYFRD